MEKFKRILRKILYPNVAVVIGGIPVTVGLMICVFAFGHENEPVAYAAYTVSAYAVTILVIWIILHAKRMVRSVKRVLRKNQYADRYFEDPAFKYTVQVYRSAAMNILYVTLKLGMGVYSQSLWLLTLGVYYMFLLAMRLLLVRRVRPNQIGKNMKMEYQRYRLCAVMLLLMNLALSGMVLLSIREDHAVRYPENMIYAVAAYDFYIIISAVVNMVHVKKHGSPMLSASRVINFAASLVAMLSLETAMLAEFHSVKGDSFNSLMLATTGAAVSVTFICMAAFMIVRANRSLSRLR